MPQPHTASMKAAASTRHPKKPPVRDGIRAPTANICRASWPIAAGDVTAKAEASDGAPAPAYSPGFEPRPVALDQPCAQHRGKRDDRQRRRQRMADFPPQAIVAPIRRDACGRPAVERGIDG